MPTRLAEHNEQAARLLRGFIQAITARGSRLVPEWEEWISQDGALTKPPRKPPKRKR
jgi:hypothetical protein